MLIYIYISKNFQLILKFSIFNNVFSQITIILIQKIIYFNFKIKNFINFTLLSIRISSTFTFSYL